MERAFWGKAMDRWPLLLSVPLTFLIASLGWIFFRTTDFHHATQFFAQLFSFRFDAGLGAIELGPKFFTALGVAVTFAFIGKSKVGNALVQFYGNATTGIASLSFKFLTGFLLLVWSIGEIAAGGFNPFIYFRF